MISHGQRCPRTYAFNGPGGDALLGVDRSDVSPTSHFSAPGGLDKGIHRYGNHIITPRYPNPLIWLPRFFFLRFFNHAVSSYFISFFKTEALFLVLNAR